MYIDRRQQIKFYMLCLFLVFTSGRARLFLTTVNVAQNIIESRFAVKYKYMNNVFSLIDFFYVTRKTVPFCYVFPFPAGLVAAVESFVPKQSCTGQCESSVVDEIMHPFDNWPIQLYQTLFLPLMLNTSIVNQKMLFQPKCHPRGQGLTIILSKETNQTYFSS